MSDTEIFKLEGKKSRARSGPGWQECREREEG